MLRGHPEVYAMCALDALGMPFMLDTDGIIYSSCQQCSKELSIRVTKRAISAVVPDDIVVVCATVPANCCAATDQCPYINFFCGAEHARLWQREHPQLTAQLLSLPEALEAGRAVFANLLRSPDSDLLQV